MSMGDGIRLRNSGRLIAVEECEKKRVLIVIKKDDMDWSPRDICFGIEFEMLACLRSTAGRDCAVRGNISVDTDNSIAELLRQAQGSYLPNTVFTDKAVSDYSTWIIEKDGTLGIDPADPLSFPFELVTPILHLMQKGEEATKSNDAMLEIQLVDTTLKSILQRRSTTPSCGLHVHISLARCHTLDAYKKLARAVFHLEAVLFSLVPERKHNRYCASIRDRKDTRGRKVHKNGNSFLQTINNCTTLEEVAEACNGGSRWFLVNFQNHASTGSVEFRFLPPQTDLTNGWHWARFCALFFNGASRINNIEGVPPTVEGLKTVLDVGGRDLHYSLWDVRRALFLGHEKDMDGQVYRILCDRVPGNLWWNANGEEVLVPGCAAEWKVPGINEEGIKVGQVAWVDAMFGGVDTNWEDLEVGDLYCGNESGGSGEVDVPALSAAMDGADDAQELENEILSLLSLGDPFD
ncbi:hypothetical protein BJ508DRAFT_361902 [Ascobolus immersus RN42]|uniref:Amidoligase enzyme n=1 Tax=Ascobolus immersus RN42 TaxID=1160509 RepID=A0A3N4IAU6_ASCIM|nr:hypothetical protein BJ508DRAFT_361902 [Ascobolus immersus RN42]